MRLRVSVACALLLLTTACAQKFGEAEPPSRLDPELVTRAVQEATALRARGQRVWCVPFARNASGIEIRGNAGTWWDSAKGEFARGSEPLVGAVMAFSATRKLPMGHVAVVSKVISEREVEIDHANWVRNKVTLGMRAVDVSDKNDWSRIRVESTPGTLGRVYPLDGFISHDGRSS